MVSLFLFSRRTWVSLAFALCWAPAHAQSPAPIRLALIEGLSGPFANTGEAVVRNIVWAVERVNARGGVPTTQGMRPMLLTRHDSKGQSEEALSALKSAIDDGAQVVLQGNSSANAAAFKIKRLEGTAHKICAQESNTLGDNLGSLLNEPNVTNPFFNIGGGNTSPA